MTELQTTMLTDIHGAPHFINKALISDISYTTDKDGHFVIYVATGAILIEMKVISAGDERRALSETIDLAVSLGFFCEEGSKELLGHSFSSTIN